MAEAKATSRVEHASILRVQDFGTDRREITYCVYENADGETLANLLARESELPVGEALDIACQTASGLAAANGNGVVHGNLTPGKILVSKDDGPTTVKVFDLGAETVGKSSDASIEYRAPETYDGGKSDERGDVYSLGVLIYQMLSGTVPFAGKTAGELKDKQMSGPPPPLSAFRPDLPPDLEPMILSAIAADPERRYQTMSAFAEDLELLSRGVVKPAAAPTAAAGRHNIWQTAFIVLAGVTVLAVALIYATSVKRSDPTVDMQADAGTLPVQPIGPATGAQEDSLAKLPALTPEEIMLLENSNTAMPPGAVLPGGDGMNPWANGGVPPAGAPLSTGQPGDRISGDPNTQSPFMPGLDLVCKDVTTGQVIPCPTFDGKPAPRTSPTPKNPGANANVALPSTTPKPMATPPTRGNPATGQPANANPPTTAPAGRPKSRRGATSDNN